MVIVTLRLSPLGLRVGVREPHDRVRTNHYQDLWTDTNCWYSHYSLRHECLGRPTLREISPFTHTAAVVDIRVVKRLFRRQEGPRGR